MSICLALTIAILFVVSSLFLSCVFMAVRRMGIESPQSCQDARIWSYLYQGLAYVPGFVLAWTSDSFDDAAVMGWLAALVLAVLVSGAHVAAMWYKLITDCKTLRGEYDTVYQRYNKVLDELNKLEATILLWRYPRDVTPRNTQDAFPRYPDPRSPDPRSDTSDDNVLIVRMDTVANNNFSIDSSTLYWTREPRISDEPVKPVKIEAPPKRRNLIRDNCESEKAE